MFLSSTFKAQKMGVIIPTLPMENQAHGKELHFKLS